MTTEQNTQRRPFQVIKGGKPDQPQEPKKWRRLPRGSSSPKQPFEVIEPEDMPDDMKACFAIRQEGERIRAAGKERAGDAYRPWYGPTTPKEKAYQKKEREHYASCVICIEAGANSALMDAESSREEGKNVTALDLESEAAADFARAARIKADRALADPKANMEEVEQVMKYRAARGRMDGE